MLQNSRAMALDDMGEIPVPAHSAAAMARAGGAVLKPELLPLSSLVPHPHLQRKLDNERVKRMMTNFVPEAIGTLMVVPSPSSHVYWVVIGQHRLEMLKRLKAAGKFGPATYCMVIPRGISEERLATIIKAEATVKAQDPVFKFWLGAVAGNAENQNIIDMCQSWGFEVPKDRKRNAERDGVIQCVDTLIRSYRTGTLDRVLKVIREAFDGDNLTCQSWSIGTLTCYFMRYGNETDDAKLIDKLRYFGAPAFKIMVSNASAMYSQGRGLVSENPEVGKTYSGAIQLAATMLRGQVYDRNKRRFK